MCCFDSVEPEPQRRRRQEVYREIGWLLVAGLSAVLVVITYYFWASVFPRASALSNLPPWSLPVLLLHHVACTVLVYRRWILVVTSAPEGAGGLCQEVEEEGTECEKCGAVRDSRTHHCGVCRKCIPRMDHHCPYLNRCIGQNNLCDYVRVHITLTYSCLWCGASALSVLLGKRGGEGGYDHPAVVTLVVSVLGAGVCWCLLGWCTMLSWAGWTHIEFAKARLAKLKVALSEPAWVPCSVLACSCVCVCVCVCVCAGAGA
mmetsp:Transcript_27321/g.63445  ORF Transcript_27321/g.63445 Transcript_27321/m.63445 type:complete len:260 (+) Transcript_27321:124-903(+)